MTGDDSSTGTEHPSDGFDHAVPKSEVDYVEEWASHFEAGDTIQWIIDAVDEVQESEIVGFSTRGLLSKPVIEVPDIFDEEGRADTVRITEKCWVPNDARSVAHIELEYRQRITASIPVDEMPESPDDAFEMVANADQAFVADALPSDWDRALAVGDLDVVDIQEEDLR